MHKEEVCNLEEDVEEVDKVEEGKIYYHKHHHIISFYHHLNNH